MTHRVPRFTLLYAHITRSAFASIVLAGATVAGAQTQTSTSSPSESSPASREVVAVDGSSDRSADTVGQRRFPPADELVDLDPQLLDGTPSAERELGFDEGLAILYEQNRDIQIARQNIEDAAVLNQQIIAIYFPQASVEARYTLNNEEVTFQQGNVYAPLSPYLDSVYDSDPALQSQFPYDATSENCASPSAAGDARCLANRPPGDGGIIRYRHDYSFSATVTQPLFNGQIFAGRKLANLAETGAYNSVEQAAFSLQEAYIQLYFQAVGLKQQIAIALRNLDNAKLTYEQARILFEEAAGTRFDATRARVSLLSAVRQVRNAYAAYAISIESLGILINDEANFNVVAPPELAEPDPDELIANALEYRPDIEGAEIQVRQSDLEAERAKARWYPTVNAQGNATYGRSNALSGQALTWSISVFATWDLYDGGVRRRDQRTAEIEQVRRELRLDQLQDQIQTNIRSAWIEYDNQKTQVENARAEVELAAENLELTREANQLGAASALEVNQAQNQLLQAELALNDTLVMLQRLRYDLYRLGANLEAVTNTSPR